MLVLLDLDIVDIFIILQDPPKRDLTSKVLTFEPLDYGFMLCWIFSRKDTLCSLGVDVASVLAR